jgi:hypothetical protein
MTERDAPMTPKAFHASTGSERGLECRFGSHPRSPEDRGWDIARGSSSVARQVRAPMPDLSEKKYRLAVLRARVRNRDGVG